MNNPPKIAGLSDGISGDPRQPGEAIPFDPALPSSIEQRAYQTRAVERTYAAIGRGARRLILHAPVGSGKTILAVIVILRSLADSHRILFIADRRELIAQCYNKLLLAGVPKKAIGVILGSEPSLRNPGAPVQVASIQSLRGAALPPATIVFIDECHVAAAESFRKLLANYPDAVVIGLSATPCRTDGQPLGDLFDEIVEVATLSELFADGYIVKPFGWSVPKEHEGDMDGVPIKNGDFDIDEAGDRMMAKPVMGYIAGHYDRHARGLRAMAFTTHLRQSREVTDVLNGAGIRAVHLDGTTPKARRDATLDDLKHGRIDIICNCGLFIQGLDIPQIKCAIMLRPTQSIVVHVQSAGRIMRPWDDIEPVLLDHVGNCRRLEHPCKDREYSLHGRPKRPSSERDEKVKICKTCYAIADANNANCPACGAPLSSPRRGIAYVEDVDLVELQEQERLATDRTRKTQFDRFWQLAYRDGFDAAWVTGRYVERFGDAPPADWTPPERPKNEHTAAQKQSQLVVWMGLAQRQGLPDGWIAERYRNKYGEEPAALETPPRRALPEPAPAAAAEPEPNDAPVAPTGGAAPPEDGTAVELEF